MCTMIRGAALLLLLLPACAGTQSQRAFIPRPAAAFVPSVTTPNKADERDRELADCFERSLRDQEAEDREPTGVITARITRRSRRSARASSRPSADAPSPRWPSGNNANATS
jgi:hypothetical protein